MAGDKGFSLNDAKCEIQSLWKSVERISQTQETLVKDLGKNREVMLVISEQVQQIAEMIKEAKSGDFTRCAERAVRIRNLETENARLRDDLGALGTSLDKLKTRVTRNESVTRILKWVAGIIGTIVALLASRSIFSLIMMARTISS